MKDMKVEIRDRQTGTVIEEAKSMKEALEIIDQYEQQDVKDGIYEANFYEAVEVDK